MFIQISPNLSAIRSPLTKNKKVTPTLEHMKLPKIVQIFEAL